MSHLIIERFLGTQNLTRKRVKKRTPGVLLANTKSLVVQDAYIYGPWCPVGLYLGYHTYKYKPFLTKSVIIPVIIQM